MAVQINVAANQAALTASIQAGVQAYNQRFAQNNQLNLTVNQRAFSQPLGRMTGDVKDFEAALAASNARVIAFGASTAVLGGVIRSFKELANVTIEVEKSLADINRVFGLTTSQLQKFSTDLFSVGKQTASSFDDASKAALEFSRQGLKAEEVLIRTKDALTLARVAGISTANSVDALTSTVNGFAVTGVTTTQILNKLVAVEQDFAVGAGDLAEALSRTGQAAQEAGVSLDQLNALVTAAQQSTARGGAVIGNALKTIFTRLQRTETLDQLEAFNIAVRDVQGNTLPAVTVLQNFAGAYKNLGDAQRAQLSEQVAGVYQVNILKAIVGDLNKSQGVYAGALQRGASATNEAEVATAKLNQTLDALLKQTATSTQQLANNIGKVTFEPLARYGTEQLKSLVESMNEILEGEGVGSTFANGLLKGIRNVIAGPGAIAAFFTLFKLIQNSFTYLAQALPQIAGITTETQNRKNIEQSILQIMQQQGPVSQALAGSMGNQAAQAQLLLQLARQQTAEYQIQSTLAKQLATQLAGQGVRVKGSGGLQVTRAGGYIPNATRMAEVVGAQAGGYTPGKVISSPVGGVMNTAEDVKYIPGFAQPFINPPAGSKAGRAHRQNAISRTGVDPYMYSGFIPNFINKKDQILFNKQVGRAFEDQVGMDIGIPPSFNKAIDFTSVPTVPSDPLKEYNKSFYSSQTFADAYSGTGHNAATNIGKVIRHLNLNYNNILKNPYSDDYFFDGKDLLLDPNFTEIIGKGKDQQIAIASSRASSLAPDSKSVFLQGLNKKQQAKALSQRITMEFSKDKVNVGYNKFDGFIPNFAPPTSAIRVPWFKKFGNAAFDTVQPSLGISKASDLDTFRQVNFRSKAKGADKIGDNNIFAPLYEDFVFKAMQLVSQPNIKDQLIRGYALQPGTDQKQSAFDAFLGDIALEYKGFPKSNLTGSISGNLNDKYERFAKANPAGAAKIKESIITFNELGHENQLPSVFGKTFSQLAGTSYSQMLKNSPDLVKGLSAETNSLLNSYVKNPAFLAMAAAKGFIPNFAYKQAVMGLEESMSGNKAIFDTKPFPHIRNKSQPTFSSAISDHGGLSNALSDSMRGQKAAGLMSKGFVPNFASKVRRRLARNKPSQQAASAATTATTPSASSVLSDDDISKAIENLITSIQNADEQMGLFESMFGGRTKLIDTELGKLKNTLTAGGVSGKKFDDAINKASKEINGQQSKFAKSLASAGTAISIAGPMIAGLAEQAVFGNRKRTEMTGGERFGQAALSTGLSAISTGAGIGAAFGPLGAGIGAAAGALVGLTSALNATKLSAEELAQLNEEQTQKAQANISAASSYVEAQKSLTEMVAKGASSTEIETATRNLANNFSQIKDTKLQEMFLSAGGDVSIMTKQLQDYTNEVTKESAKQTGLYAANLKPEERASALSIGLGKEGSLDFIAKAREAVKKADKAVQDTYDFYNKLGGDETGAAIDVAEMNRKDVIRNFAESVVPANESERAAKVQLLFDNLLNKNFEEVLKTLEKTNVVSEANKAAINFKRTATRSFNQIFLDMEKIIAESAFNVALSFEKDSGSRRIQSAVLDFSMNFQDSLNSFISNNLPDARKFDFTAATAGQKAEMLLQKSQQDYNKAIAEQDNERANFLDKSSETLMGKFKSSFLPSQASAEFFQNNVLPQIKQGKFSGSAQSLATQFQTETFNKADTAAKAVGITDLAETNMEDKLKILSKQLEDLAKTGETTGDQYNKLKVAQQNIIDLQNQTALFANKNKMTEMQNILDIAANEKVLFEQKQANAKKELEINKQLSEAKIAADKQIATEKARVDKENLMRMESMKDLSANIGNTLEISKARSAANVNALQRRLDDQRETFGMGRSQISERKFGIQADILKEQRRAEDAAINAEIQQRVLEMAAEQENTAATLKLNDTIMTLIETQLRGEIGGQENINDIQGRVNEMGQYAQTDVDLKYGQGTFAKYQALQRIQESRVASAESNTGYNTSDFSSRMQAVGFNDKMTQTEQSKFLEQEETKAREAGNVVLAGTIKRYKDQIETKKEALRITRDDIDAQIRLATEIEKVNNTFAGRFKKGWGNLKQEGDDLLLNLGENLPRMFGDGLVDGIKAAIRESDNLGDALLGVASKFLDEISTTMMRAGIYQILGSVGMNIPGVQMATGAKQKGGYIRAQSGMYISGTGSGDKYPALLENGEYVLNRRAVMAMGGPATLDTLNFSMAPRFASGGSFQTELTDLASMESGMTTYGLEQSKLYGELRDEERAKAEERRRKSFARKQQTAQMVGSLVAGIATIGIGAGLSNMAQNAKIGKLQNISNKMQSNPYGYKFSPSEMKLYNQGVSQDLLSSSGQLMGAAMSVPRTGISSVLPPTSFVGPRRQVGGLIGSRLSDTIPGYMEGGLYNAPIVNKYGVGMQAGGMSPVSNNNSNVVNNSNASNSFNFNTTVNKDGTIQMGANNTSYKQQDVELSNNLNTKIYGAVLDVIRDQQRFGGSLAGTRRA